MGTEINTNIGKKALQDVMNSYDDALIKKEEKQAQYDAAKMQESIYAELKSKAEREFKSAQSKYMNGDAGLLSAKSKYASALSMFNNASTNTDILRNSLLNSIFYAGKMGNAASIAKNM